MVATAESVQMNQVDRGGFPPRGLQHGIGAVDSGRTMSMLRGCLLALVEATPGLVMISNSRGQLLYMNGMGRHMLRMEPDESILLLTVYDFYSPRSCDLLLDEAIPACLHAGFWRGEMVLIDSQQSEIPVSQVLIAHRVREPNGEESTVLSSIAWDIREMKQVEHQLRHQATHDALTGLPNRAKLMDCLREAIQTAEGNETSLGVLFLDLDGFKQINDTLGHEAANQLLRALGQRLKRRLRVQDVIARYGGDEFVLLIPDLGARSDITRIVEQVQEVLWEPFVVGGDSVWISGSIGIAVYPCDGRDADTLLRRADSDMYRQKEQFKSVS